MRASSTAFSVRGKHHRGHTPLYVGLLPRLPNGHVVRFAASDLHLQGDVELAGELFQAINRPGVGWVECSLQRAGPAVHLPRLSTGFRNRPGTRLGDTMPPSTDRNPCTAGEKPPSASAVRS